MGNKNILIISNSLNYIEDTIGKDFKITIFETNKFYLLNSIINNFDLIVFDNLNDDLKKFVNTFTLTKSYNFDIPIILLEDNTTKDIELYKSVNVYSIINFPFEKNQLLITIELCLNFLNSNKRIQLEDGFHFDLSRELLFLGKKIIKLTKTEKKLIKLLIENPNNLVTYDQISSIVWKGKVFSIYSLRNLIMSIREKTNENFVKNYSNKGYILNTI